MSRERDDEYNPLSTPENASVYAPEMLRPQSLYTAPGAHLIENLRTCEIGENGEIGEHRAIVRRALAYSEGLTTRINVKPEELDTNEAILADLSDLFLSADRGKTREKDESLKTHVSQVLQEPITRAEQFDTEPTLWATLQKRTLAAGVSARIAQDSQLSDVDRAYRAQQVVETQLQQKMEALQRETIAAPELQKLLNHARARWIIDTAFVQRQLTCSNEQGAAEIGTKGAVTPDKPHWQAMFQADPEFGGRVDAVLRAMVDKAVKNPTMYVDGFDTTEGFKNWMKDMLKEADGQVDVVWAAWRLGLTWELVTQFGGVRKDKETGKTELLYNPSRQEEDIKVDPFDRKYEYKFATPPTGSSLINWTAFLRANIAQEYNAAGGRNLHKTGYPLVFAYLPDNLCGSYLHETKVKNASGDMKSLFEVWWKEGKSMADPTFPWWAAERNIAGRASEEPSPGSFDGWLLRRSRAKNVKDVITKIRTAKEITDPSFFREEAKKRDWSKLKLGVGRMQGNREVALDPRDNIRVWWVMALISAHPQGFSDNKFTKKNPSLIVRSRLASEQLVNGPISSTYTSSRDLSVDYVLEHAIIDEFINPTDAKFIANVLDLGSNYK